MASTLINQATPPTNARKPANVGPAMHTLFAQLSTHHAAHGRPHEAATAVRLLPAAQRGAPRFNEQQARALPYHYYRPVNTRERYRDHAPCVCDQQYLKCERMVELPCGHRMHRRCGVPWLQQNAAACPYCRAPR